MPQYGVLRAEQNGSNALNCADEQARRSLCPISLADYPAEVCACREKLELWGMRHSFATADVAHAVGEFTQGITDLLESGDPTSMYRALSGIEQVKSAFQRMHNYNHTVSMLAAKAFLEGEFPDLPWDEIEFAADANKPGPDVHIVRLPTRIVGQLKTTEPCGRTKAGNAPTKLGSNQKKEIEKDLRNLADPKYDGFARYMFVTSGLA